MASKTSDPPKEMRAITITKFGPPSVLKILPYPIPTPSKDEVLIHVRAFGLNHAEMHMRRGEWDEWNAITGLECVGTVELDTSGHLSKGEKVIALMGGMGRNRPGGYGEYVTCPASNVLKVETKLPWAELAAIPEVYATAWSCLFTVLNLQKGERLLIRGATSTIGQAALHLAVDLGAKVTATSRRKERFDLLRSWGAEDVVLEQTPLAPTFDGKQKFDKTLNLRGNIALLDSLSLTRAGGRMLQAGWLGGLAPVKDFNPMIEMEVGVHFSLFHGKVLGNEDFPLSRIPMQKIVSKIEEGKWDAKPMKVYKFEEEEVQKAHGELEGHNVGGKIVVVHDNK
jgi:NADPH:quinone reductase